MRFVFSVFLLSMGCSKSPSPDTGAADITQSSGTQEQGSGPDDQNDVGSGDSSDDEGGTVQQDAPIDGYTGDAADLIADASRAMCDAMFRCCDTNSHDWFFQSWRSNTLVADRVDEMPPNTPLDESSCPALVADLMVDTWLGDWATALQDGLVEIDSTGAAECLTEIEEATCGDSLRTAFLDSTCFSQVAPGGGEEQRRFLERNALEGATCMPVRDGFGGLYYGSCNPNEAFCCVSDGTGDCSPFPTAGEAGVCLAVANDGQACSQDAPLKMCKTGSSCMDGRCVANASASLSLGEVCYEPSTYSLMGDCVDGWCDLFGSAQCEPLKVNDELCTTGEQCSSKWCDDTSRMCTENPICNG